MDDENTNELTIDPGENTPGEDTAKSRKGKGGKPGRSGAPRGNANAARHYLRVGKLPDHLQYVEQRVNGLRRHLEALVEDARGSVSMTDAACINSICKWERHGILAQHWLREAEGKMTASDRLRFSGEIAKASDNRDRNLRLLELDKKTDVWDSLNQPPQITDIEERYGRNDNQR